MNNRLNHPEQMTNEERAKAFLRELQEIEDYYKCYVDPPDGSMTYYIEVDGSLYNLFEYLRGENYESI